MKNPLLWLELRVRIREKKLWVVSFLYLACLLGMSLIPLVATIHEYGVTEPAGLGFGIFATSMFTLLALLVILAPLSSAAAISQEREQRTLPGLLNTPLSQAAIVWGKLLATWVFLLWLIALSFPFLFLGMIWCGIEWTKVLLALGLILGTGMVTSTVALGMSGYFKRTISSYLATGAFLFLWFIVWPIIGLLMENFRPHEGKAAQEQFDQVIFYIFFAHHPVAPLILVFREEFGNGEMPFSFSVALTFTLVIWFLIGLVFFLVGRNGLRNAAREVG
jgi:ABC-type transport system involved in multi-copper enzyme maturation permease subunit